MSFHHDDPDTAKAAARRVNVSKLEAVVLAALEMYPAGLTAQEIADFDAGYLYSIAPRIAPLCRKGLVEDSGLRKLGSRGRMCVIWRLRSKKKNDSPPPVQL